MTQINLFSCLVPIYFQLKFVHRYAAVVVQLCRRVVGLPVLRRPVQFILQKHAHLTEVLLKPQESDINKTERFVNR